MSTSRRRIESARVHAVALGHNQSCAGLNLETLSVSPPIFRVHGFTTPLETEHLAKLAIEASITHDATQSRTSDGKQSAIRTSSTAWIGKHFGADYGAPDSAIVQSVLARAAALVGVSPDLAEGVQVLRYPAHAQFRHHQDAHEIADAVELYGGHNRLATMLLYLNDADSPINDADRLLRGGETNFPHARGLARPAAEAPLARPQQDESRDVVADCESYGLGVAPCAGDALLFYNLHESDPQDDEAAAGRGTSAAVDLATVHAGCPVLEGVKWAANIWLWDGRPPPRKLLYTLARSDGRVVNVEAAGVDEARRLAESM